MPYRREDGIAVSPERLVRNQVLFREVNERIAEVSASWGGAGEYLCECSHDECVETLTLSALEYERIRSSPNVFVIVPGHESSQVDRLVETSDGLSLVETKHRDLRVPCQRPTAVGEGGLALMEAGRAV